MAADGVIYAAFCVFRSALLSKMTVQITLQKPRLAVPASLIVDDPAPCINPLYYFRLQVDRANYDYHEPAIPLDFLEQYVAVCKARGIRGKFSVLPYPAGLGSILDGWEGCDKDELARWLHIVRTEVAPDFDITPEILTHTLALDLATGTLLPQSEHEWLAQRTRTEITAYFVAALELLKAAGFAPAGITQPCYFNGSREDYTRATLDAIRQTGGPPVTYYFIDGYFDGAPFPPPEVVLLDRERGEAVVNIIDYTHDHFWFTQRHASQSAAEAADKFITADGSGGRLAELARDDAWLIFVCHWQSLYGDGSRQGLLALDEVAARLARTHGPRLTWLTLGEIARYRAASEACAIDVLPTEAGCTITLDAAIACPDFTFSLQAPEHMARVTEVLWKAGDAPRQPLAPFPANSPLLSPGTWRANQERIDLCIVLHRGRQTLCVM